MACGHCGERLIHKSADGIRCCGCGHLLEGKHAEEGSRRPWPASLLVGLLVMILLPFVGAITVTDQLRSGPLSVDVADSQEAGAEP